MCPDDHYIQHSYIALTYITPPSSVQHPIYTSDTCSYTVSHISLNTSRVVQICITQAKLLIFALSVWLDYAIMNLHNK